MIGRAARRRRRDAQGGTALFVALAVVAVLMTVALGVNRKVQRAAAAVSVEADRTALSQAAGGAIHAAMALLVEDKRLGEADHLYEDWADENVLGELAAAGAADGITLALRITDEKSKIQVNALVDFPRGQAVVPRQQELWERLLAMPELADLLTPDQQPSMIVSALKDWLDRGDDDAITGLSGVEATYYETLSPPYACRNGPMRDSRELLLVAGFPQALLDGAADLTGIGDHVTVYGRTDEGPQGVAYDGRININTAAPAIIAALLPEESRDLAQAIVEYRQDSGEDGDTGQFADPRWYRNAPGCQSLEIDPALVTISSDLFRIEAQAARPDVQLTLAAVVERYTDAASGRTTVRILRWQPS